MHHAAPGNFQPVLAQLFHERVAEINLEARLGVTEIVRTKSDLCLLAEQFLEDKFYRALEVANGDVFVHVKSFDLLEGRVVRGVGVVAAIDAARHDDAHRWRLRFHHADLNGGSVGAEKKRFALALAAELCGCPTTLTRRCRATLSAEFVLSLTPLIRPSGTFSHSRGRRTSALSPGSGGIIVRFVCKIESVLRVARRMVGGRVERVETIIFVLDLRAVGDHKTNFAEAADDVLGHLRERMEFAERTTASGQREIGRFPG